MIWIRFDNGLWVLKIGWVFERKRQGQKWEVSVLFVFFLSSLLPSSPSPCTDLQLVHSCSRSVYRSTLHASVFCWIHLNSRQSTVTVNCSSQAFAQSWQEHLDSWHSAKCFFLKIDIRWYLFVHVKHAASQTENYCNQHCVFFMVKDDLVKRWGEPEDFGFSFQWKHLWSCVQEFKPLIFQNGKPVPFPEPTKAGLTKLKKHMQRYTHNDRCT